MGKSATGVIRKFTEGVGIVVVERPNTGTAHVIIREQLRNKTDPGLMSS